jgi:hypothetical protein
MGELDERLWAVMSERGCEATSLTYAEAVALESELKGEQISGLCIITDSAARHLRPVEKKKKPAARGGEAKRPRRVAKRGNAGSAEQEQPPPR